MTQLQIELPEALAESVEKRAADTGLTVSRYVADLIQKEIASPEWPEGFFERVAGSWRGESLERPPQPLLEERESW